jgi:hypothetical protein
MQVVTIDAKGRALQHVVHVSESAHEELMWVALGNGGPWQVTFDKVGHIPAGSPFSQSAYQVPQAAFVKTTGGPNAGTAGKIYKYNVRDATGNITDDPDVDIE